MIMLILPTTSFHSRSEAPAAVGPGARVAAGRPRIGSGDTGSTKIRGGRGAGAGRSAAGFSVASGAGAADSAGALDPFFFPETLILALHLGQWNFFPSGGGASNFNGTPQEGQLNRIGDMVAPHRRKYGKLMKPWSPGKPGSGLSIRASRLCQEIIGCISQSRQW